MKIDYFACTLRGQMHKKNNLPNQDAWAFKRFDDDFCALVCDGLGSKKLSQVGSKMACKVVLKEYQKFLNSEDKDIESFLAKIIQEWKSSVEKYDIEECSTTCLFIASYLTSILYARIGDGLICLGAGDDFKISADDKSDSFSNITNSLGARVSVQDWDYQVLDAKNYNNFFLTTDGIYDDLILGKEHIFAKELMDHIFKNNKKHRYAKIRKILANWTPIGSSDDKTVLAIKRK